MMPIVSKRQHVDRETGRTVEGLLYFTMFKLLSTTMINPMFLDWDLMFADDEWESNPTSFKFLQVAHAWKNAQAKTSGGALTLLSGFTASSAVSAASGGSTVIQEKNDGMSDVVNSHE